MSDLDRIELEAELLEITGRGVVLKSLHKSMQMQYSVQMQCRCSADQRGSVHDLRASRAGRWAKSNMGRVLLLSPLQLGVARDDSSVQGHARGEEARDKPFGPRASCYRDDPMAYRGRCRSNIPSLWLTCGVRVAYP